jgi:hypothetical protein
MPSLAVIIPFRDRGIDPLRKANLDCVLEHWRCIAPVLVQSDDRVGQFNRSRAYNLGAAATRADILVFAESDILVAHEQVDEAISLAADAPGLVVPFTQYRALTEADSHLLRTHAKALPDCSIEYQIPGGQSTGAVNIVSRETLRAVGQYDETFEGSWYDDTSMARAFEVTSGSIRRVEGSAYHLYHLPGWKGDHLSDADRAATERNEQRWQLYLDANTPERIRELTSGGA